MADSELFDSDGIGKKVGPLPLWGWALVMVVLGYVVWKYFANRASGTPGAAQAVPNISTTGGYLPLSQGTGAQQTTTPFTDNTSWENAAIGSSSQYGSNPIAVQGALDNYLAGKPLSQQQGSLINQIVSSIGAAPLGTQGTPSIVSPSTAPSFQGFIRNPAGTISALFSNKTISEYSNYGTFASAASGVGTAQYTQLTQPQYAQYSKIAPNYEPGFGTVSSQNGTF